MKSQRQWTLAKVTKACRSAPAVWLALEKYASEKCSRMITPTRPKLAELSGIVRVKTISQALGVLERAGWLKRSHLPVHRAGRRCATYIVITLLLTGRHAPHKSAPDLRGGIRPSLKGRKSPRLSFKERNRGSGLNGPAPSLSVGSEPSRPLPYSEPKPITAEEAAILKSHSGGRKS